MDLANLQVKFPELEIIPRQICFFGKGLEYFNFRESTYKELESGNEVETYAISKDVNEKTINGLICGCAIREIRCSLIFTKEHFDVFVGFVRGKDYFLRDQEIEANDFLVFSETDNIII